MLDSYIELKDGSTPELDIPSGSETGLKINKGPLMIANTLTEMTVDVDLRSSIVFADGTYKLKPVLKLLHDDLTGTIIGTIEPSTLASPNCSDSDPTTGNAVYLFEGFDAKPDDVDGGTDADDKVVDPNKPDPKDPNPNKPVAKALVMPETATGDDDDKMGANPVASALITLNEATGEYEYEFGFIPYGKYTIAFTCQAGDDIEFNDPKNVKVTKTKKVPFR